MCSPMAAAAISAVTTATATIATTVQQRKNAKYSAQIAKTNAKIAASQGKKEEQEGIEQSREEKLKGLQKANLVNAQNAANGFDISSGTNLFNFQDTYIESENEAKNIQKNYNSKAQDYYSKANSYLNQSQNFISNYNSNVLNTALGKTSKVASSWSNYYTNNTSGGII